MTAPRVASRAEVTKLKTEELHAGAHALAQDDRDSVVSLLLFLGELDARRQYGTYGSLWNYCIEGLAQTRGEAFLRVKGARLLRRFPQAIPRLRDGRLSLSAFVALRKVLDDASAETLFEEVRGKSKKEIDEVLAMKRERVVAKSSIVVVPPKLVPLSPAMEALRKEDIEAAKVAPPEGKPLPETYLVTGVENVNDLKVVSATQCEVTITVSIEFRRELRELAELESHAVRDGDPGTLIRRAVQERIAALRKKRGLDPKSAAAPAAKPKPAPTAPAPAAKSEIPAGTLMECAPPLERTEASYTWNFEMSGTPIYTRPHIPAELEREIWRRDGGCCQWEVEEGICGSRWRCVIDHKHPVALGGKTEAENLRLLCEGHNLEAARQAFGSDYIDRRIAKRREEAAAAGKEVTDEDPSRRK